MNPRICFLLQLLSFHFQHPQVDSSVCRDESSQHGFALLHKNYSSSFAHDYSDCLDLCLDDPSCMSLNFWLDTKQCDLNNHSRETCPACYMEASSRYMGMARSGKKTHNKTKLCRGLSEYANYIECNK